MSGVKKDEKDRRGKWEVLVYDSEKIFKDMKGKRPAIHSIMFHVILTYWDEDGLPSSQTL